MLDCGQREAIKKLIEREVIPAIGCTEPVAVALCSARAAEILGCRPERIEVLLSANILKNAMGVGIPGTGMTGLPIAIALGVLVGRSEYKLEVLRDVTDEAVAQGKQYIDEGRITIGLKKGQCDKLYIEVHALCQEHRAVAVIECSHCNIDYEESDGEVLKDLRTPSKCCEQGSEVKVPLTMAVVYDYATQTPVEEMRFILESRRLNKAAAEFSFKGEYGHCLGRTIRLSEHGRLMGDGLLAEIMAWTSAACDARMGGAQVAVMSNSGSGNQGIAATMPVVIYGEAVGVSEEQMIRVLVLSHLTVIYIKQSLGRLSALCGCVVAATGSSCGITWLMGGDYRQITFAVKNMIANLTGVICDGAKPSCSMKLTTGVSTAVLSAIMAINNHCVSNLEGIIDNDVDRCIDNLTLIGRDGMNETDRLILDIMTHKQ